MGGTTLRGTAKEYWMVSARTGMTRTKDDARQSTKHHFEPGHHDCGPRLHCFVVGSNDVHYFY